MSETYAKEGRLRPDSNMMEVELRNLKIALNERLNGHLVEMRPGFDDSITGFNEAWDVMDKFFDDRIAKAKRG